MKNYVLKIGDTDYKASVLEINDHSAKISVNGNVYDIDIKEFGSNGNKPVERLKTGEKVDNRIAGGIKSSEKKIPISGDGIKSPMPGVVLNINVKEGERITAGVNVMTIEAMKMENEIKAPYDGIVGKIHVSLNDSVSEDELLIELKRPAMTTL